MTSATGLAKGYLYTILAAVLWGVSGSVAKFLFHSGVSPFQLVQMRMTIAAGALILWLLFWNRTLLIIVLQLHRRADEKTPALIRARRRHASGR